MIGGLSVETFDEFWKAVFVVHEKAFVLAVLNNYSLKVFYYYHASLSVCIPIQVGNYWLKFHGNMRNCQLIYNVIWKVTAWYFLFPIVNFIMWNLLNKDRHDKSVKSFEPCVKL